MNLKYFTIKLNRISFCLKFLLILLFLFGGNTVLKIKYAAVPLLTKTVGDFAAITTNKALKGL